MNNEKLYAQIDENNICFCVSTHETDIEATYENVGQKRVWIEPYQYTQVVFNQETQLNEEIVKKMDGFWEWQDLPKSIEIPQISNLEIAQMLSDLQADLIIAGVI